MPGIQCLISFSQFNTTDFRTVYCLTDNWFRDICCISLESIQLHAIEDHVHGRLNPKNMYCVLPIFHQQLKNVFLPLFSPFSANWVFIHVLFTSPSWDCCCSSGVTSSRKYSKMEGSICDKCVIPTLEARKKSDWERRKVMPPLA